jgi:hypothetical protein
MQTQQISQTVQIRKAFKYLMWSIIIGLASNIVFAFQSADVSQGISVSVVGFMYSGAALLVGCFIGFLFGIPRTLQQNIDNQRESQPTSAHPYSVAYRPNTNLEQISDWLTKILVGVSLTQISSIPLRFKQISAFMAAGLGNFGSSGVFAITLLIFFSICGFLAGYLWTRLYLIGAFREADRDLQQKLSDMIGVFDTIQNKLDPDDRQKIMEIRKKMEDQLVSMVAAADESSVKLNQIAREYENLRSEMVPSRERTYQMSSIFARVRALALQLKPNAKTINKIFHKGKDGDRIVALGLLQGLKFKENFDIVINAIEKSRSAFEQYQGLSVAISLVPEMSDDQKNQLRAVIEDQRSGGDSKFITKDSDRWPLSDQILEKLR